LDKRDYDGAASLWEIGVQCQPGDVNAILELTRVLLLKGDKVRARERLSEAQTLKPQNEALLALFKTKALALPASQADSGGCFSEAGGDRKKKEEYKLSWTI